MTDHPSSLIPRYAEMARRTMGSEIQFEFSKYMYVPQEVSERRDVFTVKPDAVAAELERQTKSLEANEEIAFHSRIIGRVGRAHIPFIDMGCEKIEPHLPAFEKALKDFGMSEYSIFHSGRSFHIYVLGILPDDTSLIQFMGRMLLLNLPKQERIIDERWVGHRLMAGYLTLRWTNNNPHYKSMPRRYELRS